MALSAPVDGAVPEVSVIVRSMGRPTLEAALASIAEQRGVRTEVLIVAACGSSHPAVPNACGPHPMRLVTSDVALLRAAAANAGLDAATGEWITFLDDDDLMLPDHLAGLHKAASDASHARVITSYARGVFEDGRVEYVGQPFCLAELYERSFIHLSSALLARELVVAGCRFDESLEILEDWDFMLQLAQVATFHFVPLASFHWNAEAGDSGAAGGANHDAAKFATHRDRIYAKWEQTHDTLVERTRPLLERAAALAQAGRPADADALCAQVLAISANDPWALNLRAMMLRRAGRIDEARKTQAFAVAVRPQDAGFVYNLALLDRAFGDLDAARKHAHRSLELDASLDPARALLAELGPAAS
jgi:tetratricopeptide (TPR) repeat protein